MKEKYVKPKIILERFTLSQNIAATCQGVPGGAASMGNGPTAGNIYTCKWYFGGTYLFISGENCEYGPDAEGELDADIYCYNNPDGGIQMFGS